MNSIKVFNNPEFGEVRTLEINGEAWFVGKDIAERLGYSNTRDAIARHVDEEDKTTVVIPDAGSNYKSKTIIINESGMYSLVLFSQMPDAKRFKHWITSEVLPAIHKYGMYATPQAVQRIINDPNFLIGVLTELQKEQKKNQVLTEKIEADKPLTEFAEAVGRSRNAILIGDLAKLLRQNGINTGQNRLFAWLRENDYLISRKGSSHNMPEQWAMESGLFIIKESVVKFSDGTEHTRKTTMITGKGQLYFINLFCGSDGEEDEDDEEEIISFLASDD